MNKLQKIDAMIKFGGFDAFLLALSDKLTGKNQKKQYFYRMLERADPEDYSFLLKRWYKMVCGKTLDLENPKSFNEKIQWLKLYDATPLKTQLADKYLSREWLKERFGEEHLVPLLGCWECFDDIDFNTLPDRFALKCNHGSGWNIIVDNKSKLDIKKAKEKFDYWMSLNFAYKGCYELQYKDIHPLIIAEQYLEMSDGSGIKDYRFYCFNGKPMQVWVDLYSGTPNHIRSIFDMDWNKLPFRCGWPDGGDQLNNKPINFDLMASYASQIAKHFLFIRVDYFEVQGKLYFGELTFTPMNGQGKFEPDEWDERLGSLLHLPIEK